MGHHSVQTLKTNFAWECQSLPTFFQLLDIAWSCDLHWGHPLVNGVNWRDRQVGLDILCENRFSSVNYALPTSPKLW